MRYFIVLSVIILFLSQYSCYDRKGTSSIPLGEYWIEQGTKEVLDYWMRNSIDTFRVRLTLSPTVNGSLTTGIMEKYAWDSLYGGYYRSLNRDLSVQYTDKDFSPQLAPVSGYLIYLYLATGNTIYLEQMEKIINTVTDSMSMPGEPWILERFDRTWYQRIGRANPAHHNDSSPWWIQAYGNMLSLYLYHETEEDVYLKIYQKGAES
ncbi:MAG: hypothetical protein U9N72_02425 [Bacteroidota bacterium]|nr:hypothetical protein [Bacteroidota bacterium]